VAVAVDDYPSSGMIAKAMRGAWMFSNAPRSEAYIAHR
jgi:hypothetical protein